MSESKSLGVLEVSALGEAKALVQKDEELSKIVISNECLLKFLRSRSLDPAASTQLLKNYVNAVQKNPLIFGGIDRLEQVFASNFYTVLDKRGHEGEVVTVLRSGSWDPSKVDFNDTLAATVCAQELTLLDDAAQQNGFIEIIDVTNVSAKIYFSMTIRKAMLMIQLKENVVPIKWKKIFIVNQSRFADLFYRTIQPFLSKELKRRISVIGGNYEKILEFVPREALPEEYGGTAEGVHAMNTYKNIIANKERLLSLWKGFVRETQE